VPDNLVWSWVKLPRAPDALGAPRNTADLEQARAAGKGWINSRRSLAARVPSVIVPDTHADFNVLLNPVHEAYNDVEWSRGSAFRFDPRLFFGGPRRARPDTLTSLLKKCYRDPQAALAWRRMAANGGPA